MSGPLDNTEEYTGEDFIPIEYTENISSDHVQHVNEIMGSTFDTDDPCVPELDHTAYDSYEWDN